MNRKKYNPGVHATLLTVIGGYLLFIAWHLFDSMRTGAAEMSDALYILLTVLFTLAGAGELFYAYITWRKSDREKKREEENQQNANEIEQHANENEQR